MTLFWLVKRVACRVGLAMAEGLSYVVVRVYLLLWWWLELFAAGFHMGRGWWLFTICLWRCTVSVLTSTFLAFLLFLFGFSLLYRFKRLSISPLIVIRWIKFKCIDFQARLSLLTHKLGCTAQLSLVISFLNHINLLTVYGWVWVNRILSLALNLRGFWDFTSNLCTSFLCIFDFTNISGDTTLWSWALSCHLARLWLL